MKRFAFVAVVFWMLAAGASAQTLPETFSVEQNGVSLTGSGEEVPPDVPEKKKVYDRRSTTRESAARFGSKPRRARLALTLRDSAHSISFPLGSSP